MTSDNGTFKGLPSLPEDEVLNISAEGLNYIIKNLDSSNPNKNFLWTSDYRVQLPVRVKKAGHGSEKPYTFTQMWLETLECYPNNSALNYEVKPNQWDTLTYKQYFQKCVTFGKALIALNISNYSAVNIIGFNSPQWAFAFAGSIFAHYLPIGIYTTNNAEACEYIANHSECEIVILEDRIQLQKYLSILPSIPRVKKFVIWKDSIPENLPADFKSMVMTFDQFMKIGETEYNPKSKKDMIETRMTDQKPGNCCTFIYTSGTTGPPKAVMISHDNYTWIADRTIERFKFDSPEKKGNGRALSLLPLSHVAAQVVDLAMVVRMGGSLYFADPSALQGNLLLSTIFMSVPRVWQKMEDKITAIGAQTTGVKRKIADWAKSKAADGTFAQVNGGNLPAFWGLAKKIVFNKIKENLGLDKCQLLMFSAAPMRESTRLFFMNLNFFLFNCYGMSQLSGPETFTNPSKWKNFTDKEFLKEAGKVIDGLQICIDKPDNEGNGQICLRGRNTFMGYFKNEEQTKATIDGHGFVHSGDVGKIDSQGNLTITGRIKELIITAGGENVAPVLIENQVNTAIPLFSHVVVIGQKRKYLTALMCFKLKNATDLTEEVVDFLAARGSSAKTGSDAANCPVVKKLIDEGLNLVNSKVISRAQRVQKYTLLTKQFTTDGGELTPTMKLKRKIINTKYQNEIEAMYIDAKL